MAGREADRGDRADRQRRGGRRTGSTRATRPENVRIRRASQDPKRARRPQRPAQKSRTRPAVLLGLSTTRRAALLAIVVCALALSVAVPLRTYLGQRAEVEIQEQREAELRAQVEQLEKRKAQLDDPAQVEAEARRRLRYVRPGETPYVVELPGDHDQRPSGEPAPPPPRQQAWYETLWDDVAGNGR
ncbi:septum formation initiator family protein [Actinophytocola sp.]|uniref:FtsB family cell division protein n=1 Tax=Actinophytocola sp. TaxID=1872138 RepID=UPI002D7E9CBF|nr:septum formation initiator family protein [Actinophytocola sp.]HET9141070.1 septum formation initiator family protein [Actinophytocola sp.]